MREESLRPCPCGETPKRLVINEGSTFRWREVSGDCGCGWMFEARIDTMRSPDETKDYAECVEAWNQMARG